MSKEEFVKAVIAQIEENETMDKDFIINYISENYHSEEELPEEFNKFEEMHKILNIADAIETIAVNNETEETLTDSVLVAMYGIALIEGRKRKIDILKVRDEFGIDDLITKYEA